MEKKIFLTKVDGYNDNKLLFWYVQGCHGSSRSSLKKLKCFSLSGKLNLYKDNF